MSGTINQEDLQKKLYVIGQVIGFFLERLDLPVEIKKDIANIIPELDIASLEELSSSLENSYYDQEALKKLPDYNKAKSQKVSQLIDSLEKILNKKTK